MPNKNPLVRGHAALQDMQWIFSSSQVFWNRDLSAPSVELLFAVHTAVYPVFLISQFKAVRKLLFHRGDASRIPAFDHIGNHIRQIQHSLFRNFIIADYIDGDIFIQNAENIKIHRDGTFYLNDILFAHFVASGIFDNGHGAV